MGRVGELFHFLVEPVAAAGLDELLEHHRKDFGEVRDVADRIVDLPLVERAAAPVGKARALVELNAEPGLDQVRITDLFGLAERHLADLRVEDGGRRPASQLGVYSDIPPAAAEALASHFLVAA